MFLYEFVNSNEANHIMMWPANYQHFFHLKFKINFGRCFRGISFDIVCGCLQLIIEMTSEWNERKNEAIVNMNVGKSLKKCRWPWSNDIDDIIVIKWARIIMKTKSKKKKKAKSQTNVELRACVCVLFLLRKMYVFCIIYLFI